MRTLVTGFATCMIALMVTGCSSENDPPAPATTTTSAPVNPDAALPEMPDTAKEFSPNGAASFVSYYVSVLDYASKTGDVDELRTLSAPDCAGCNNYIDTFTRLYSDGGHAEGRNWSTGTKKGDFNRSRTVETSLTTVLTISAGTIQKSANAEVAEYPATSDRVSFAVMYADGWRVTQFGIGAPQ